MTHDQAPVRSDDNSTTWQDWLIIVLALLSLPFQVINAIAGEGAEMLDAIEDLPEPKQSGA